MSLHFALTHLTAIGRHSNESTGMCVFVDLDMILTNIGPAVHIMYTNVHQSPWFSTCHCFFTRNLNDQNPKEYAPPPPLSFPLDLYVDWGLQVDQSIEWSVPRGQWFVNFPSGEPSQSARMPIWWMEVDGQQMAEELSRDFWNAVDVSLMMPVRIQENDQHKMGFWWILMVRDYQKPLEQKWRHQHQDQVTHFKIEAAVCANNIELGPAVIINKVCQWSQ